MFRFIIVVVRAWVIDDLDDDDEDDDDRETTSLTESVRSRKNSIQDGKRPFSIINIPEINLSSVKNKLNSTMKWGGGGGEERKNSEGVSRRLGEMVC